MSTPEKVTDAYRESFKYFKNYVPSSKKSNNKSEGVSLTDVVLPYPPDKCEQNGVNKRKLNYSGIDGCECYKMWGLRPPKTWTVVELEFPEGLIVIKNPFTSVGQRYWISRSLLDFPHHSEYVTNMDNLNRLEKLKREESVENVKDFKLDVCGKDFYEKLRWVTFGYHHDWDTKVYSEKMRSNFPEDLADMTKYMSQLLGFPDFEAEAAIANYYHMDSTLSGHVDRSEVNQGAPLFSLSFGQSAIFLIGGKTKSDIPKAVLLQSGDIAVMSGESRMSYHGVPKVLPCNESPWTESFLPNNTDEIKNGKRPKLDITSPLHECTSFTTSMKDPSVSKKIEDVRWTRFVQSYISKSRINLNIRQVLFPGQSTLHNQAITQ